MTLNNLKHEAEKIRLTSAERSAMRASVFEVSAPSPYFFFSYQFRMSMAGLLLFVLAGTGTVSAAQGALPGDLLYPVKISVNEKVEVALAPTPAAKAEVQVRLAGRRVDEAKELSVRGRLDKKIAEKLTADFDEHAAQAVAFAESEERESDGTPVRATMTVSTKKLGGHRGEIRESLHAKGEMLKEIKTRLQKPKLQIGD